MKATTHEPEPIRGLEYELTPVRTEIDVPKTSQAPSRTEMPEGSLKRNMTSGEHKTASLPLGIRWYEKHEESSRPHYFEEQGERDHRNFEERKGINVNWDMEVITTTARGMDREELNASSMDIISLTCLNKLRYEVKNLELLRAPIIKFGGQATHPLKTKTKAIRGSEDGKRMLPCQLEIAKWGRHN
ncbi:hypothetical protein Cgig2_017961 [Carnegiea gigantea]|uniref:Uncharacterized protein n=1 Tax=Carnegiea gigantea TaxID=171969 RepID=A0A9Q1K893_9CARY|nr:hypothetical protein Cgig2_017961 [Carnegiea gigantea]